MKRFSFGLEKVLRLRQHRERETELELGKAVGELTRIEREIGRVQDEREQAGRKAPLPGAAGLSEVLGFDRYMRRLEDTLTRLREEAVKAERKVDEAREVYLAASRERKVLDKIKEKREQEYRKKMFAEEIKAVDDIR